MTEKLTKAQLKRRTFAELYHVGSTQQPPKSAAQCAVDAGYSAKGAKQAASRLLTCVDVKKHLARLAGAQTEKTIIDTDAILDEVAQSAMVRMSEVFTPDGSRLLQPHEWGDRVDRAIQSVKVMRTTTRKEGEDTTVEEQVIEVRLNPKLQANELLGKNKKAWTERLEITDESKFSQMILARAAGGKA